MEMIRERLSARPLPVQIPLGVEDSFRGVIDLLSLARERRFRASLKHERYLSEGLGIRHFVRIKPLGSEFPKVIRSPDDFIEEPRSKDTSSGMDDVESEPVKDEGDKRELLLVLIWSSAD